MTAPSPALQELLHRATAETLEGMAFLEVLPAAADAPDLPQEPGWSASVPVLEPQRGEVELCLTAELADILAEDLIGPLVDTIDENLVRDALAELTNTLAGRLLNLIVPTARTFQLGLPTVTRVEHFQPPQSGTLSPFDVSGRRLSLVLTGPDLITTAEEMACAS